MPFPPHGPHGERALSIPFRARLLGALLVLGAAALGACDSATDPDAGLNVALAITPDTVRIGRPAEVTVTVTNRGSREKTISPNPCSSLVVTTPGGEVVGPGERICAAVALQAVKLAPGERFVFQTTWMGDGIRGSAGSGVAWLLPGEYRLRAQLPTRSGLVESAGVPVWVTH